MQIGGVVHQFTWNVPGYPGNWFVFGKSAKFYRQSSGAYFFDKATDLGTDPAHGGRHSGS